MRVTKCVLIFLQLLVFVFGNNLQDKTVEEYKSNVNVISIFKNVEFSSTHLDILIKDTDQEDGTKISQLEKTTFNDNKPLVRDRRADKRCQNPVRNKTTPKKSPAKKGPSKSKSSPSGGGSPPKRSNSSGKRIPNVNVVQKATQKVIVR